MSMNLGSSSGEQDVMTEMNTTPLIDVMLVLLIMLIITIPVQTHAVKLNMPAGAANPPPTPPIVVRIDVDFDGTILWNGEVLARTVDVQGKGILNPEAVQPGLGTLESRLREVANTPDQPEVHLRPNKLAKYEHVAYVMATAQRFGVKKLGVIGNEQFVD
jgi:biopolymer transport protein ExbD